MIGMLTAHLAGAAVAPCHRYESCCFRLPGSKRVQPTAFDTSSARARLSFTSSVAAVTVTGRLSSVTERICGCSALPMPRITSPAGIGFNTPQLNIRQGGNGRGIEKCWRTQKLTSPETQQSTTARQEFAIKIM